MGIRIISFQDRDRVIAQCIQGLDFSFLPILRDQGVDMNRRRAGSESIIAKQCGVLQKALIDSPRAVFPCRYYTTPLGNIEVGIAVSTSLGGPIYLILGIPNMLKYLNAIQNVYFRLYINREAVQNGRLFV